MKVSAHRPLLGALVMVGAAALMGCEPESDGSRPPIAVTPPVEPSERASTTPETQASPSASEATTEGAEVSVLEVAGGDCFTAVGDQIETVTLVDCQQPHVYEAFHAFDHEAGSDGAYPGDDAVRDYADAVCQPPFGEFVDHDYQASVWFITSITPSADAWASGDREIVCALNREDKGEVTGSAEGAAE